MQKITQGRWRESAQRKWTPMTTLFPCRTLSNTKSIAKGDALRAPVWFSRCRRTMSFCTSAQIKNTSVWRYEISQPHQGTVGSALVGVPLQENSSVQNVFEVGKRPARTADSRTKDTAPSNVTVSNSSLSRACLRVTTITLSHVIFFFFCFCIVTVLSAANKSKDEACTTTSKYSSGNR